MDENQNLSLGDAAGQFLSNLPAKERSLSHQEIYRFVRWYGAERQFRQLTASEVANYAEKLSSTDTDYARKLDLIRSFLAFAWKHKLSRINLVTHLKPRRGKTGHSTSARTDSVSSVSLTRDGLDALKIELETLKKQRSLAIEEVRRAAADKDFRENAPLEAARELRGRLEGQIRELEITLKTATVIDSDQKVVPHANIGDTIVLHEVDSGKEVCYTIVGSREANPTKGKISDTSPLGKALIGQVEGDTVELMVPIGKVCYRIKKIEH